MDPIALEDLALLEVLRRIDQGAELVDPDGAVRKRLYEDALAVEVEGGGLELTSAGVELAKSLQHRKAADIQADKLLRRRNAAPGRDDATRAAG
jgi:hypothetical protein